MILSYLLEPNWGKHNLERLAIAYLHLPSIPITDIIGKGKKILPMNKASIEAVAPYACQDADYALEIGRVLWPRIEEAGLDRLYCDLERPLIEVLADMERIGIKVDRSALQALSKELETELGRLEKKIYEACGTEFNIQSPAQLGDILFRKLQLSGTKKTKTAGALSTSMEVLEELAAHHPLPRLVLEYRQLSKLRSTYADALLDLIDPETGRVHTSYNQTVASTGPALELGPQPAEHPGPRRDGGSGSGPAFVPEKGFGFLAADYSQIELRVLAHLSGDPGLIEIFASDRDVHEETADRVFGTTSGLFKDEQRRRAKIINFSMIYGAGAFSLAGQLGTSNHEAQASSTSTTRHYPKVKEYLDRIVDEAAAHGILRDALRPETPGAGAQVGGQEHQAGRPPHRPQQPAPGDGGRHHQEGHDRPLGRAPEEKARGADGPPGPRRARPRGPQGRAPRGRGDRPRADGERLRVQGPAQGLARLGPELGRSKISSGTAPRSRNLCRFVPFPNRRRIPQC